MLVSRWFNTSFRTLVCVYVTLTLSYLFINVLSACLGSFRSCFVAGSYQVFSELVDQRGEKNFIEELQS